MRHRAIKSVACAAFLAVGLAPLWPSGASAASVKLPAAASRAAGSAPTAYVPNGGAPGKGAVVPISTATNTAGTPIKVGEIPYGVMITPDGKTAYVLANTGGFPFQGTVTPISTATGTAGKPIKVGRDPGLIAITPDGKTVYVTNFISGTVTPVSTATNTAG